MVLSLDMDTAPLHNSDHLGSEILKTVCRRYRKVALLVSWFVSKIRRFFLSGIPDTLYRVNKIIPALGILVITDIIKDKELGLRAKVRCIAGPR
ncbi:hypothetical protein BMS3Abin08_00036 [bacterium BMS3Abin08]|nr:hypothetical protein BMS3Abin08_00036 [bacterium BMS3Abin08]